MVKSLAWKSVFGIGVIAVIWGVTQIVFRSTHPLLPEDVRFTGVLISDIESLSPALLEWIGLVMRAWGAFIFSSGVFMMYLAAYGLRKGERWSWNALFLGGVPMFIVFLAGNLVLRSDFLIAILVAFLVYCVSLLYLRKTPSI